MDKLKIGVIMEDCLPSEGGGYSYYQALLTAINRYSFHPDIEIVNVNFYKNLPEQWQLNKKVVFIRKSFIGRIAYRSLDLVYRLIYRVEKNNAKSFLEKISRLMDSINNQAASKILQRENIHLIYYLKPRENLINYPMIITHLDVGHKSMYPFPEVTWNGNYEKRDEYYKMILSKAFLILCESKTGSKELQKYYPVNPDKIRILPLFGGDVVEGAISEEEQSKILRKYNLTQGEFFIYPAQFWAHKNHSTLIHAFCSLVKEKGNESLKLVLCGSDKGNLGYVKKLIDRLDLNNSVILPGFILNCELYALYKNALALVMPTFLGPTNIPLIEAAELKCAVICSNLEGHKEIMGTNALYFDPSDVKDIKDCLQKILDHELRERLVSSAYRHIKESSFQVEKSIPLLDRFLQQIKPVRNAWGMNLDLLFVFAEIGIICIN